MEFTTFIEHIRDNLSKPLPGLVSHMKMIPEIRKKEFFPIPENAVKSSTLLLLFSITEEIYTVLIKRQPYNGVHSAQISFPGGKFDKKDVTLEKTAIREAEEEIGIDCNKINIIGHLSDLYIPPSNFIVRPFIGYFHGLTEFKPNKYEVSKLILVNIKDILTEKNIQVKKIKIQSGLEYETPYFSLAGETVWGATAMILKEFSDIAEKKS